jgi:hypothetical protein
LNDARYRVQQQLRAGPDVDVTLSMLLGESDSDKARRSEMEFGHVETTTNAVRRSLLVPKPMADAETEELRDSVPLCLRARATLLKIAERRRFAINEAVERQPVVRDWNGDRRCFREGKRFWLWKRRHGRIVSNSGDTYHY